MNKRSLFAVILTLLSAIVITSCKSDESDNPDNVLTENMVTIAGISDIDVSIDNLKKTIDIEIPYENKDAINALTLEYVDLPQGAIVSPVGKSYDFSNNQRRTISVSFADDQTKVYSVGVTVKVADPRFITLTVGGVPVTGVRPNLAVKLKASADLTKMKLHYTVSPENTTVEILNDTTRNFEKVDTTLAYSFSDKLNGRTFRLTCNNIAQTVTVIPSTSGFSKLVKVWQVYANRVGVNSDFYGVGLIPASPSTDAWDRNLAMDDNYIYIARANKSYTTKQFGVYAIKISDKSVTLLDTTGMYNPSEGGFGAHATSDVQVIGGKIVACNLANSAGNNLKVFVWENVTSKPIVALNYNVGTAPSPRLGDKFTFTGDWNNGKLYFVDYNANNRYYVFSIANGAINKTPEIVTVPGLLTPSTGSTVGLVIPFNDTEWWFSGTGKQATIFNPVTKTVTYTTSGSVFPSSEIGDVFFEFNDQKYLAYMRSKLSWKQWCLSIRAIDYNTLNESIENISDKVNDIYMSGVTATEESSTTNGNATGKVVVHKSGDGTVYIAAVATGQGIALYKLE